MVYVSTGYALRRMAHAVAEYRTCGMSVPDMAYGIWPMRYVSTRHAVCQYGTGVPDKGYRGRREVTAAESVHRADRQARYAVELVAPYARSVPHMP
eukprot:2398867-Rhodomonas_salina.2